MTVLCVLVPSYSIAHTTSDSARISPTHPLLGWTTIAVAFGGELLMTSTRWLSTMALRVTTPSCTTAQMMSSYIAGIPPTHPLLSWATIAVALGGELLMTSTRWLSTMALRVTTPSCTTAQMMSSYIAGIPPTHPPLS